MNEKQKEQLKFLLNREKEINKFLSSEVEELKKINNGLRLAYEKCKTDADYCNGLLLKYQNYFPYIEKFRKSIIFKVIKKIRRKK